ncbi:MAG: deoxyribose-phosphate aldolase [Anaerolineales bacterium]
MTKTTETILARVAALEKALPAAPAALKMPHGAELAAWIDHTLLKPEATPAQIEKLCAEAREYHFATVCINPVYVPLAEKLLRDSGVPVCAVIGFPLGATTPELKAMEAGRVAEMGAAEIDMVIHIGALKADDAARALEDVQAVSDACHARGARLKVILEMALLTRHEKILGCVVSQAAAADFVKTSTGFGPGGATVEDVALMRAIVGEKMGVKAAGGIRSLADARTMVAAGANRLGASAGVAILREELL